MNIFLPFFTISLNIDKTFCAKMKKLISKIKLISSKDLLWLFLLAKCSKVEKTNSSNPFIQRVPLNSTLSTHTSQISIEGFKIKKKNFKKK